MSKQADRVEGLRPSEVENCKFVFSIYESDKDKLDSVNLPKLIYALNINPSLDQFEKVGVVKKAGEKFFSTDEVLKMYSAMKKEVKDMGCYEDFIELLKLSDKLENGWMPLGELLNFLLALGEKLSDAEVDEVMEDCMGEEDDDGNIEYTPFLRDMCEVNKD